VTSLTPETPLEAEGSFDPDPVPVLPDDEPLVVTRMVARRWYLGLVGAVLVIYGGGVLFGWPPTDTLLGYMYPGRDIPAFENRDQAWAILFLISGTALILWTAIRLLGRKAEALRVDQTGWFLSVAGPFRAATEVRWEEVESYAETEVSDDYGTAPALLIGLSDPDRIGPHPWGARWVEPSTLCVLAQDWSIPPEQVVQRLEEIAESRSRIRPIDEANPNLEQAETSWDINQDLELPPPSPEGGGETFNR